MPVDAEQQRQGEGTTGQAQDVHQLLAGTTIIWPQGVITVRGIARSLRAWPSTEAPREIYGEIHDRYDKSFIRFKCKPEEAPRTERSEVVLRGSLRTQVSKLYGNVEVLLIGACQEERQVTRSPQVARPPIARTAPKLPLERFMSRGTGKRLVFLGTRRALQDARAMFGSAPKPEEVEASTDLALLREAVVAAAKQFDGLCLVRGGGDPAAFETWESPELIETLLATGVPFYTGIGHAADTTLTDLHADESFETPTALGRAYAEAWKARAEWDKLREQAERAETKLKSNKRSSMERNLGGLAQATASLQALRNELSGQVQRAASPVGYAPRWRSGSFRDRRSQAGLLLAVFLLGAGLGVAGDRWTEWSRLDQIESQLERLEHQWAGSYAVPAPVPPARHGRQR